TGADISLPGADTPVHMRLLGANPSATATTLDPLPGRTNYLTGADPAGWQTGVPTYGRVSYAGVWPGVDIVFLGDERRLRHDFVVAPGADPSTIAVTFEGDDGPALAVDPATGDLILSRARLSHPTLYQDVDGTRRPIQGSFRLLAGGGVGFSVGAYDRTRPLVIDPTLVTSS